MKLAGIGASASGSNLGGNTCIAGLPNCVWLQPTMQTLMPLSPLFSRHPSKS